MNIALTKAQLGIQDLANRESKLVYNEDSIETIKSFLEDVRKAKKVISDTHKEIKEPILRQSQEIDASKREMEASVDVFGNPASQKYTKLCEDIADKIRKQQQEEQRKQLIQEGIGSNMINFSTKIANCKTNAELLKVESLINLEKSYKTKYAEFLDVAVEKFNSLTVLIKAQKENIKEFEKLEKERLDAEKKGNDEALLAIQEKQETLNNKTEELKVTVQETAINQSSTTVTTAQEILPTVKARRSAWSWKPVDLAKTAKSCPSWVEMQTVDEKIDEFMKASKEQWIADGKDSLIINGIEFYLKVTY
jgi:hypothetical protein